MWGASEETRNVQVRQQGLAHIQDEEENGLDVSIEHPYLWIKAREATIIDGPSFCGRNLEWTVLTIPGDWGSFK